MGWLKNIQKLQWKDLDPSNKNSQVREELAQIDKNLLQPIWEQLGGVLVLPIVELYISYIEGQARGKYKPLPQWLKLVLNEKASQDQNDPYEIDLNRVGYAEEIDTVQKGNAMTIGYNIHFPRALNLDRENPDEGDVRWMLHELEHVVQYKRTGGVNPFLLKYVVQSVIGTLETLATGGRWKDFINNVHDNLELEKDADAKADNLLDFVLEECRNLALGRPAVRRRNLGSRLYLNNEIMHEGDYLQSDNGLYRFICQQDGNIVLYGPGNSVVWMSSTDGMGRPPYRIVGHDDGNVIQHDRDNNALWRTGTQMPNHSDYFFILENYGHLVLYWPSNPPTAVWRLQIIQSVAVPTLSGTFGPRRYHNRGYDLDIKKHSEKVLNTARASWLEYLANWETFNTIDFDGFVRRGEGELLAFGTLKNIQIYNTNDQTLFDGVDGVPDFSSHREIAYTMSYDYVIQMVTTSAGQEIPAISGQPVDSIPQNTKWI